MTSQSFHDKPPHTSDTEILNIFLYFRKEVQHEFDLISGRLNAFLSAQSFLILAYAAAMNNTHPKNGVLFPLLFPMIIAIIGVGLSFQAHSGISGADETVNLWNQKIYKLIEKYPWLKQYESGRREQNNTTINGKVIDSTHEKSLLFARNSPWIFGIAWFFFAALAIILHYFKLS
jgi:hypothetical protein